MTYSEWYIIPKLVKNLPFHMSFVSRHFFWSDSSFDDMQWIRLCGYTDYLNGHFISKGMPRASRSQIWSCGASCEFRVASAHLKQLHKHMLRTHFFSPLLLELLEEVMHRPHSHSLLSFCSFRGVLNIAMLLVWEYVDTEDESPYQEAWRHVRGRLNRKIM
jgi:hypothetical protein